ncbi:MAG: Tuberous sclerosis 2-like protein [Heterodermia speciosa]|uniref:Tuberous sclerosis 2-like protein n=1 Tax=Heterodermia speciosa TaxID=116794 RepID=A0A8H3G5B9_9LECA|nr:MAG: Tuberous sclerosis 2-like protein [Heterodermia speciosa]
MDSTGQSDGRARCSSPRRKKTPDDAQVKHMKPEADHGSPSNEIFTPTLAERVRDLAVGRRSTTLPQSRVGGDAISVSSTTALARSSGVSAGQVESDRVLREKCLQKLDPGRPLKDRIGAIKAASYEIRQYSIETLRMMWSRLDDLSSAEASLEARQASFDLLSQSALHPGLGDKDLELLFSMITTIISPTDSRSQVLAVRHLTQNGAVVAPFKKGLSEYLVTNLKNLYDATLEARSAVKKTKSRPPLIEENILEALLDLINEIIDRNPTTFENENLSRLVQRLISIANKTTVRQDLKQVALLFRTITNSLQIPSEHFESTIEVLCGISRTTDANVGEATWATIINLLASSGQAIVLDVLFDILRSTSKHRQGTTVRGALLLIKHFVEAKGGDGVPLVDIQQLLYALHVVVSLAPRLQGDCLQILISCLEDRENAGRLLASDWSSLNALVYLASNTAQDIVGLPSRYPQLSSSSPLAPFVRQYQTGAFLKMQDNWKTLQRLAYAMNSHWYSLNMSQRSLTLGLLFNVGCWVDDSTLGMALEHIIEDEVEMLQRGDWLSHLMILLEVITFDTSKPLEMRHRVLVCIEEAVQNAEDQLATLKKMEKLMLVILKKMAKEFELVLTNVLVKFLVRYALRAEAKTFKAVLAFVVNAAGLEATAEQVVQNPMSSGTHPNCAATYLVWLFQQCLVSQLPSQTKQCFDSLVLIASNATAPTDSRLITMKLLSRLRCNSTYALRVVSVPDTLGLAAALCRTQASAQAQTISRGTSSRASVVAEPSSGRTGRMSGLESSKSARSRSTTRSADGRDRFIKATAPLWMYPGSRGLPVDPLQEYSKSVFTYGGYEHVKHDGVDTAVLEIERWLDLVLDVLQHGSDWEIYSYILVHLPSQLTNVAFFAGRMAFVQTLHRLILLQLRTGTFHEPPASTGVKKGDVALCLYNAMTVLLAYQESLGREQLDETVRIFFSGIGLWDRAAKSCIHALALCSHEIPTNLRRSLLVIIQKMSQIITQSHLAVDILEFLAGLVRLPNAYHIAGPESQDFLRTIFGICISYIHYAREQKEKSTVAPRSSHIPARYSGVSNKSSTSSEASQSSDVQRDLPEYVFALAYHVLTFWFLAIDLPERSKHVGWIVKNLTWKDEFGNESMEEQSQVALDMIHRTAYNDLGETQANVDFDDANGPIKKETWLYGMSIISLETVQSTGLTLITKRQASGTTHAMYQQYTARLPPHHVPMSSTSTNTGSDADVKVFPQHVLLQLGFTIAPVPIPLQPILLPEDDFIKRAISTFDRNDTVDGHKSGVIYMAQAQTSEISVLANTYGSKLYETFLSRLGTKVRLQDAKFNTQGLDRESDLDGTHTYAWRDRVTEIVFHVITMMPTFDDDPQCTNKKRHIGNDYVKIIFNESGLPFRFETFASQFNHVNIVITPELTEPRHSILTDTNISSDSLDQPDFGDTSAEEDTAFFTVQTLCSSSFPLISPAATPKVVSASALPGFVRQLALNASVLSLVWSNREGGENLSSWRNRLKEILKLRQRYANTGTSANVSYPGMGNPHDRGGAPSYVDGDRWTGKLTMAGLVEQDQFLHSADFTRWN